MACEAIEDMKKEEYNEEKIATRMISAGKLSLEEIAGQDLG